MHVLITGAAGFLGSKLLAKLCEEGSLGGLPITKFSLVDIQDFQANTGNISCIYYTKGVQSVLPSKDEYDLVFHLAAVTSSQAEAQFNLGFDVNVTETYLLLEKLRKQQNLARFVMTSSIAVFGTVSGPMSELPAVIPSSSYGMGKGICELLVHDYGRRNFVDGRALRLPTIVARPGEPNAAASSFLSSIIREPLAGQNAECYASPELAVWLGSPDMAIRNIIHAACIDPEPLQLGRMISLPGISITIGEMIATLRSIKGHEVAERIQMVSNPSVESIVASWPSKLSTKYAENLGFSANSSFVEILEEYCQYYV